MLREAQTFRSDGAWPTTSDPFSSSVSLLLRMEGTGAIFTDSSTFNHAISAFGNAGQTTTQSKWPGGKSLSLDGNGDYLTVGRAASLQFSTGDFTVEFWEYLNSRVGNFPCLFSNYFTYKTQGIGLFAGHSSGTTTRWQVDVDGVAFPAIQSGSGQDIQYGVWQHVALVRASGQLSLYIDGTIAGTRVVSTSLDGNGSVVTIGASGDALTSATSTNINGFIDDFRVTKGVARYTANFTPPVSPF